MARNLHVVMIPWSAFGHLMPFFQLSIALAKAGIKVSFISTPRNIQRLPKVPPTLATLVDLVALPLPALDDKDCLPEGAEATVDVPSENIQYLKIAYDLLRYPIKQFISDQRPDWIIIDVIPCWVDEIAQAMQIPVIYFSVSSASATAFLLQKYLVVADAQEGIEPSLQSLTTPLELGKFSSSVAYRSFEESRIHEEHFAPNASGITDVERVTRDFRASKAMVIRTCPEYESEYLYKFEQMTGKPVIPIGLLLPEKPEGRRITDKSWTENFGWLDAQKPNSVVFVGFGSEYKLSKEQVYEIAYGVELSGLPFLWALRKPDWATDDLDALPPGFNDRTRGRGVVCIGWAPQLEILGNPSIGGSFFHSGWGSIIETLQFGHCLVVLPFIVDQPLNARFLVEKGLAVEVERSDDGSFSRDGIAKALRLAMVSEEGKSTRVRAKEAAQVFGNRTLQGIYVDRFVAYLEENGAASCN
ncbi:hypothetical protein DITRI_Ditri13aG0041400 [Diplodiscus trichospermus]